MPLGAGLAGLEGAACFTCPRINKRSGTPSHPSTQGEHLGREWLMWFRWPQVPAEPRCSSPEANGMRSYECQSHLVRWRTSCENHTSHAEMKVETTWNLLKSDEIWPQT